MMLMPPEPIKITIYPSGADSDTLTVADAMHQVLDYIALLEKAEPRDEREGRVVWRLKSASTNSPLTIEAEPSSSVPDLPLDRRAYSAAALLADGLERVLKAESRADWIDADAEKILRRVLERNTNGIGRTDILVPGSAAPVIVDSRLARRATNYLEVLAAKAESEAVDWTRKERGSLEGNVLSITSHYNKPAIIVRARLSGRDTKCVLTGNAESIGRAHSWDEVWAGRRVLVSGVCHFDQKGDLTRVDAEDVMKIPPSRQIEVRELRDPSFSDGLTAREHADAVWGDDA